MNNELSVEVNPKNGPVTEIVTLPISTTNIPYVVLQTTESFIDVIHRSEPTFVFWNVADNNSGKAGFLYQGIMIMTNVNRFMNLQELLKGYELGFDDGNEYRKAIDVGAKNSEEYYTFLRSGFSKLVDFREMQKTDLPLIYEVWLDHKQRLRPTEQVPAVTNIFQFKNDHILENNGFENVEVNEIIDALKSGYLRHDDYLKAKASGFPDSQTYFYSIAHEIFDFAEFEEFEELKIIHEHGWKNYKNAIEQAKEEGFTDILGKVLFKSFNSSLPDKSWSFSDVKSIINSNLVREYRLGGGSYYSLVNSDSVEKVIEIANHPDIQNLVFTYNSSYIYRRTLRKEETFVANIDLCNVVLEGYEGAPENRKGNVNNFLLVVEKLKTLGVHEINVFADASVVHYLTKSELKQVKEQSDMYRQAETGFPADMMMIKYSMTNPSFMVTNDHMEGYKNEKSPWIFENIPRLLVPYFFDDKGKVSFGIKEAELTQPIRMN